MNLLILCLNNITKIIKLLKNIKLVDKWKTVDIVTTKIEKCNLNVILM